jgi:hypothetical protein
MTKDEHIKLIDTLNKKLQYLNLWNLDEDTSTLTDLDAKCEFEVRYNILTDEGRLVNNSWFSDKEAAVSWEYLMVEAIKEGLKCQ